METTIKLADYTNPKETALVGRINGETLLKNFQDKNVIFKSLELSNDKINIIVPNNIITINKSFFLGWLETRVQELGKTAFISKYNFIASEHIKEKILEHIDAALLSASQEDILGV